MKIKDIYKLAIEMGIANDPRGKHGIERTLNIAKKRLNRLSKDEREFFDRDSLTNPYADTRLLYGETNTKVQTILAGIDINSGDIALAKTLNLKPDLIINHHPHGKALAALDEVMHLQADLMAAHGVPINVAEGIMKERISQVNRSISGANHNETVDTAKLAKIPFMCVHTPCDNNVYNFLTKWLEKKNFDTVGELVSALKKIPEYKVGALNNAGPSIIAGSADNRPGKILAFDITGGTGGAKEIYPELVRAGVGTVIGMHMKDESRDEALRAHLNVVIAGHISSDSIGMNLFLDKLAQKGLKIIPTSGLIRVKRTTR